MFLLKKLLGKMALPLGLTSLLLTAGLVLLFTRRTRPGRLLILAGTALLCFLSLPLTAELLLRPLESRYPVLDPESLPSHLAAVVVLSGGALDRLDLPPAARLGADTLQRTLEGLRLWRARPQARLILSGGDWSAGPDTPPPARLMAELAVDLGAPPEMVVVEAVSRDTAENAAEVAKLVGQGPLVLVSTASHLPRAMAYFHRQGLSPLPAPTDHKLRRHGGSLDWLPSPGGLALSQEALHEYLGLAWAWLRGRI